MSYFCLRAVKTIFYLSDCVSVLSFLLTIVAEEEAKSSTHSSQDPSSNGAENSSNFKWFNNTWKFIILILASRLFCAYEDVADSTSPVPSSATGRQSTIICNSSDIPEFVKSSTDEKSSSGESDESDSDSSSSMESQSMGISKESLTPLIGCFLKNN
jgi:hypothetical protein